MSSTETKAPVGVVRTAATEPQREFWASQAKFRAYIGGVGAGKSRAGCTEILRMPPGSTGMVVAPTYPMLMDATLASFFELYEPFIAAHNKQLMTTRLVNGTTILWRSADRPNRLRGPNLGWFFVDEACYCAEETWKILIGRLRKLPGRGWLCSTPRGFDWVYKLFHGDNKTDFHLVHASSRTNSFLPSDFVQTLAADYSSAFAEQEIEGRFVDLSGGRVRREWFKYGLPQRELPVTLGVDLASRQKTSADYTAIVASCFEPNTGDRYVLDVRRDKKTFNGILNYVEQAAEEFKPVVINVENVAAQDYVVQELRRTTSLPVKGVHSAQDKLMRFAPVEAQIEHGHVWFAPDLPGFFEDELLNFGTESQQKGRVHDDTVDALVLSLNIPSRRAIRLLA